MWNTNLQAPLDVSNFDVAVSFQRGPPGHLGACRGHKGISGVLIRNKGWILWRSSQSRTSCCDALNPNET